ncbi:major histocompatibility complex class I-related gene protein-like [Pimephales promelas]|uniref:major histocompatibility complex class I-related gene protein-like n=1 Tax=Pimephales promelas TaxID=90988 RepID=UPI00195580CE|nr:major histocompatibility complex class I-related gene protein-like [Pimephales promelas]
MTTQQFLVQKQGFSYIMSKFIIFFIFIPLVYSELHRFIITHTEITGQTIAGTSEFSAVTTLDDQQIDYYDSNIKKLIPRQDWMKDYASTPMWKEYIEIRKHVQQIHRNNIHDIMERFNHTHGVHVYQRRYGCEYDDETGDSDGFDEYGYDGEDFIKLDLKEDRYITHVPQGFITVEKWNKDTALLTSLKQYYNHECVYWLREFLHLSKDTFNKAELPKVSLLQKNPDYYTCHVTGFLYRDTSISWRKNGQAMSDYSAFVESGDTRPNEDGTFQRTLTLFILPDEWKKNNYTCVVEHKSLTEPIQKTLTEDHIKTNRSASDALSFMYLALIIIISFIVVLIGLCVILKLEKTEKFCLFKVFKKTPIYHKSEPSQEQAPALVSQVSLLSTPSKVQETSKDL